MKIIIVGAGEVGINLAEKLAGENHEVTIIEKDENLINKISDKINALFIHGTGTSFEILHQAGIKEAEMFIAVTNIDEVNLISCFIASKYNIPHIISRVSTDQFPKINYEQLGISQIINTNIAVVDEILNLIEYEGASEFIQFEGGKVLLFGLIVEKNSPFVNKSLMELNTYRNKIPFLIVAIQRDDITIIPKGYDKILPNDHVLILTTGKYLQLIKKIFLKTTLKRNKKIYILGASKIGIELAKRLEKKPKINVVIAEQDYYKCLNLNNILSDSLVLNIDGLNIQSILTEQLEDSDIFIATTKSDEVNLVSSTIMKKLGVKKTFSIIRKSGYSQFIESFGVDVILSPRLITASNILQYVRKGEIIRAVPLLEDTAEIIEFKITPHNKLLNKKLNQIKFPEGAIIGAIIRGNKAIIPSGDTEIKNKDKLILFVKSEIINQIQEFLS